MAVLKRLVNVGLLTSIGVLVDANAVNPTMSQKKMVTSSNCSAWTDVNNLSWSATGLYRKKCHHLRGEFSDKFANVIN